MDKELSNYLDAYIKKIESYQPPPYRLLLTKAMWIKLFHEDPMFYSKHRKNGIVLPDNYSDVVCIVPIVEKPIKICYNNNEEK